MSDVRPEDRWHKNSRLWKLVPWIIVMSFGLAIWLKDSLPWVTIIPILITAVGAKSAIDEHHTKKNGLPPEEDLP